MSYKYLTELSGYAAEIGARAVSTGCDSIEIPLSHNCAVIGTSTTSAGTTQAIERADIYVTHLANNTAPNMGAGRVLLPGSI
jgi:hypothetical protein